MRWLWLLGCMVAGCQTVPHAAHSDALWQIVSQKCVPHQQQTQNPAPCAEVDLKNGFVVLKDQHGPYQYLLMPIAKITGIESPVLQQSSTPPFLAHAWQKRTYVSARYGHPIPDTVLSLAINSPFGRSQNHLHIHISCVDPEVEAQVAAQSSQLKTSWQDFPETIHGHHYFARVISETELDHDNIFQDLDQNLAHGPIADYGLALIAATQAGTKPQLVLLATAVDKASGDRGSAEEIQDHSCPQLKN